MSVSDIPISDPNFSQALKSAISLLGRRDCSYSELREFLSRKSYPESIVKDTIKYLQQKRLYDEYASAERLARSKIKKSGIGPLLLEQFLKAKRFPEHLISDIVSANCSEISELNLAQQVASKKLTALQNKKNISNIQIKAILYRFLAQKGFTAEVCDDIIGKLLDD